jgi:hypothetical protein
LQNSLLQLVERMVSNSPDGPAVTVQFRSLINDFRVVGECLQILRSNDNFSFAYCNNMLKLIENDEFNIVSETRSEENMQSLP